MRGTRLVQGEVYSLYAAKWRALCDDCNFRGRWRKSHAEAMGDSELHRALHGEAAPAWAEIDLGQHQRIAQSAWQRIEPEALAAIADAPDEIGALVTDELR